MNEQENKTQTQETPMSIEEINFNLMMRTASDFIALLNKRLSNLENLVKTEDGKTLSELYVEMTKNAQAAAEAQQGNESQGA